MLRLRRPAGLWFWYGRLDIDVSLFLVVDGFASKDERRDDHDGAAGEEKRNEEENVVKRDRREHGVRLVALLGGLRENAPASGRAFIGRWRRPLGQARYMCPDLPQRHDSGSTQGLHYLLL